MARKKTASAEKEQRPEHWFKPGQSGIPKGRAKGSRNKLGEAFIADMYADWEENGPETIERVREERPEVYLKVVASILPKELNVKVSDLEELPDDEIDRRLHTLAKQLARYEDRAGAADGGAGAQAVEDAAHTVSTVQ